MDFSNVQGQVAADVEFISSTIMSVVAALEVDGSVVPHGVHNDEQLKPWPTARKTLKLTGGG